MGDNVHVTDQGAGVAEPRHTTIRQRIALAMVLLVVLVLLVTGSLVYFLERGAISQRIVDDMQRRKAEFTVLAHQGVDPETGEPFGGPEELLETYLTRTVLGPDEGELGVVAGRLRWKSSEDVEFFPEDDEALMAHVLPMTQLDVVSSGTVRTEQRRYRYLVTPVKFPDSDGALVQVHNLSAASSELNNTILIFTLVAAGAAVMVSAASWGLVGRLLRPVEALRAATESIDEHDLTSRVPERGNDDLTRLSRSINRMLDRLQTAVDGQRTLLDDVGHELRTPLTIIRGHLELVDTHDPVDVRQTRDLAMDELDRMGGLVNDLLTLASADQTDFVQPHWYSLAILTDRTLERARGLGDRSWRLRRIESVDAFLDPDRITQAWLQLAANAVKYSEPGSAITLASELVRGEVHLSVEDRGIGIHPDEITRIRSRFGRGRDVGDKAGAGLGLSIVQSIMAAHRGRLDISSEPGVGSTFTLVLPLAPTKENP